MVWIAIPPRMLPIAIPRSPETAAPVVIAISGRLVVIARITSPPSASPKPKRRSSASVVSESERPANQTAAAEPTKIADAAIGLSPANTPVRVAGGSVIYSPERRQASPALFSFHPPLPRNICGQKGSNLEGRAHAAGAEARPPVAPPTLHQPAHAEPGQDPRPAGQQHRARPRRGRWPRRGDRRHQRARQGCREGDHPPQQRRSPQEPADGQGQRRAPARRSRGRGWIGAEAQVGRHE